MKNEPLIAKFSYNNKTLKFFSTIVNLDVNVLMKMENCILI